MFSSTNLDIMKKSDFISKARIILGVVFLAAAVFRIFSYQSALSEMAALNLPSFLAIPIIIFELLVAVSLLSNRFVKISSCAAAIFIGITLLQGIVVGGRKLLLNMGELFVFNPTPTDIFLHLIYLVLFVFVWRNSISSS